MAFSIADGDVVEIPLHRQLRVDVSDPSGEARGVAVTSSRPDVVEVAAGGDDGERLLIARAPGWSIIEVARDLDPSIGFSGAIKTFRATVPVRKGTLAVDVRLDPGGDWRTIEELGSELDLPENRHAILRVRLVPPEGVVVSDQFLRPEDVTIASGNEALIEAHGSRLVPVASAPQAGIPISISADTITGEQELVDGRTLQVAIVAPIGDDFEIDGELEDQP